MGLIALSITVIVSVFIIWYSVIVVRWVVMWVMYTEHDSDYSKLMPVDISVIVAVRNEASNVINCLNVLSSQNPVPGKWEIIISDDYSSDNTVELINKFISTNNELTVKIRLITGGNNEPFGKKAALERAIAAADGDLIVTTDADCRMNKEWLRSINKTYQIDYPVMITGFVKVLCEQKPISWFEALDVLSLSGSGAVFIIDDKPLMCNGANLAFSKKAFLEVGRYAYGKNDPSGDDTYLMLKLADRFPSKIKFNKNRDGVVSTIAAPDLGSLVSQRIRWSSKVKKYNEKYIKRFGLFLFFVNVGLLYLFFSAATGLISFSLFLTIWLLKILSDLIFLLPVSAFAHQRKLLFLILPAQILYPFYMLTAVLISFIKVSFNWKGRIVSN